MNAAWAYAARITDAFAKYGWMARTRGVEGGGKVEGLPVHTFPTDDGDVAMKCPTEIAISDRREFELSNLGFLPLLHSKGSDFAVFMGAQSCQKPKTYFDPAANANAELSAKFNLILCTSRFAHYLKVMARDKIGSFMEVGECGAWLNDWINNYVVANPENVGDDDQGEEAARRTPRSRSGRSRASRAGTRPSPTSGRTSSSRRSRPRCGWSPRSPRRADVVTRATRCDRVLSRAARARCTGRPRLRRVVRRGGHGSDRVRDESRSATNEAVAVPVDGPELESVARPDGRRFHVRCRRQPAVAVPLPGDESTMAFDTYMKIDGGTVVEGEATATSRRRCRGRIEIFSFSWGASNPTTVGTDGGGPLRGQGLGLELQRHEEDRQRPRQSLQRLLHRPALRRRPGRSCARPPAPRGKQQIFLQYDFTDVMVESIQWSGSSGGDDTPTESVSFAFGKVSITYNVQDTATGDDRRPARNASWDLDHGCAS